MTSFTAPISTRKTLGGLIRVFRHRPLGWIEALSLLLPGGLAVLTPLIYGYWRARYAARYFGPVAAAHWSRPWYILAGIAFLVFLIAAIYRLWQSRQYAAVHAGGLRFNLTKRGALRWEQIAGISTDTASLHFLGISTRPRLRGVIYPNTGKPIHLTDAIQDLPELLTILKAKLYPRLLPNLQSNLNDGQWLHFGRLAIQKKGIKLLNHMPKQDQPIPWSHITQVDVDSGFLVVELCDRPQLKLPVSQIPNIELLIQLIQLGVNS
jgi:hypothetical protein